MAVALAGLDDANREAWDLYRKVVTQLSVDLNAGGIVLDRLTRDLTPSEFDDTWRRIVVLYSTLHPPAPTTPKE